MLNPHVDSYADGRTVTPRRRQKAEVIADVIVNRFANRGGLRMVDFGCADGAVPCLVLESPAGGLIRDAIGLTLLDYNDLPGKPAFAHPRFRRVIADVEGSLEHLPLSWGKCDLVTATAFLHYLGRPGVAFAHAARLLRPGGLLVVSLPAPWMLWLRRRGVPGLLAPNNRIRFIERIDWWTKLASQSGFEEIERRAIQWLGLDCVAPLERLLRRTGILGTSGSNLLAVYQKHPHDDE